MQQKILVVTTSSEVNERMEEILSSYLEKGGELLFAPNRNEALRVLETEKPAILFLDNQLVGEGSEWIQEGTHVILLREPHDNHQHGEDFVDLPLKRDQVLEKCEATLASLTLSRIPPM